ncbi:MAG: outer membrane protein assembly factor BamB [Azonexus sp.]|jgi:outer membrane protein assembly factor BamB|uniref:outer membrane protein assembly factor BamB n=1 Tax=Azonexus sp. TaxID=1872668 RepID=UPI0028346DE0|nr:outer membrane protein assembly factor BamB [Azonexus sp.]MDR0775425.1 outer membrane protein assembly factor BamB [Azonexus sp.]
MNGRLLLPLVAAGLLLGGCASTLDKLNPFSSSGPKPAKLVDFKPTADVRNLWSTSIGKAGDYTFAPAVVDNAVFVAGRDGSLSRIEDGRTVWKIATGHTLSAGVGASHRLVVVGTPKGDVLAYAADDGKPLWQAKASSEVLAAPTVGEDGVAVRSGDNRVFLFDLVDGGRKWVYQRATPTLSIRGAGSPVFADRYLFVGFPGGRLVALALQNGALAWEGTVAQPRGTTELDRVADVVAPPVVDGSQICAVAFQGKVACFDMGQGGALIWSRDLSSATGLALDGRYLFVTDDKGAVHALDRLTGSSLWKQDKLVNRAVSGPAVGRGLVAVGDVEGNIHFLSREDGAFAARLQTDGTPVRGAIQPLGSGFLVQTVGGSVNAIEAQ